LLTLCLEIMIYLCWLSCCLFHSLPIILPLAVGCLLALCPQPLTSSQVRITDEEEKLSVNCGYLDTLVNH
uniref:Uncharacterized protein n=1 Tax=Equus caballus TaxID=9796 RepID=A0A3Q2HSV6_HORSE